MATQADHDTKVRYLLTEVATLRTALSTMTKIARFSLEKREKPCCALNPDEKAAMLDACKAVVSMANAPTPKAPPTGAPEALTFGDPRAVAPFPPTCKAPPPWFFERTLGSAPPATFVATCEACPVPQQEEGLAAPVQNPEETALATFLEMGRVPQRVSQASPVPR